MSTLEDSLKTMVRIFRRECHRVLQSERTTIHGADGMLMVLQLAIAEVNKQERGEFKVALSDVLLAWKHLLLDRLHLPLSDSPRPDNYDLIREAYGSFLKRSNTMDLVDIHSMYKQLRVDPDPEQPLSPVQLFEFLSGSTEVSRLSDSPVPSTPSSKPSPCSSQVKRAVRRVFCSYLDLLVNSKNDMALAHTLDMPSRALGQTAFTDLKHAARNSGTSLFLAVTSFVRVIHLGGKGYAPALSDPLRKHIKGLSDFVQFVDDLEEVLGETPDPSVCGARLVASIRAALVKGRGSHEEVCVAAGEATKDLKERISQLHHSLSHTAGGTGISPARPKAHTINHATALGGRETVKVLMALLDEEALTPPSRNKADLLSEEQLVLSEAEGPCSLLTLFRSPAVPTGSSPEPLKNRVQSRQEPPKPKARERGVRSQFACTYQEDDLPLSRVLEFPSASQVPTCVHPAPKRNAVPAAGEGPGPERASPVQDPDAELNTESENRRVPHPGAALGPRSGNAPSGGAGHGTRRKTGIRPAVKRKQVDEDQQHGGSENQPPHKKPPATSLSSKMTGKKVKAQSKKLIAGQGKLTSFFRV